MSVQDRYVHIKYFKKELKKIEDRGEKHRIIYTSYTRRIILENGQKIFFSRDLDKDKKSLILIQSVRRDAQKFINSGGIIRNTDVEFFNLLNEVDGKQIILKIDVKSAYWTQAILKNIISEKTNELFLELYKDSPTRIAKNARLKALGSLATTQRIVDKEGKKITEEEIIVEPTKSIYIEICRCVDELMKDISKNVDGCVYYYWDCIFIKKEYSEEAIDYIKSRGFDVSTIQETRLEIVTIGNAKWVLSMSDSKSYMTRYDNKDELYRIIRE